MPPLIEYDKLDRRRSDWQYDVKVPQRSCPMSRQGNGSHPTVEKQINGRNIVRVCRHCFYELDSTPIRPLGEVMPGEGRLDE